MKNNPPYIFLLAGLEIAVAPSQNMSRYAHKPLPSLPFLSNKSSHEIVQHHESSNSLDTISTRRISTFQIAGKGRNRRRSIMKIQNLLGHSLDYVDQKPKSGQPSEESCRTDTVAPQLPQVTGLSKLDGDGHMDTFIDVRRHLRSSSQSSLASASVYSQDNTVEEIVDTYSKWGSWAPDPHSPIHPAKKSLYLQPAVYSASAAGLRQPDNSTTSQRPSRASIDGAQIFPNATTLADLITEEREYFGAYSPRSNTRFSRLKPPIPFHNQNLASADPFEQLTWSANSSHRRDLLPQPLALMPRSSDEPHRSMSRWSNHSSEDGGMPSTARDSIISHIRNISSPFKVPSRPSTVFNEKAKISTVQISTPEPRTRKRAFSSGKHPLKSPFPLKSPLHKKSHLGDRSDDAEKSSFARRISDSFKQFSSSRKTPIVEYRIISNHARTGDGPDTPLPIKPGSKAVLSPTAVFFQRSTLHIQDAVNKAKRAAKAMSREERRRDRLRKKIVVVGTTNPSSSVSRWV